MNFWLLEKFVRGLCVQSNVLQRQPLNDLWEQIASDRIPELARHPLFSTKAPNLTGSLCFMVFPHTVREGLFTVVENLASGFMTLGEFFVHSKLQFPHLKGKRNNSTVIGLNSTLIGLRGLDKGGNVLIT